MDVEKVIIESHSEEEEKHVYIDALIANPLKPKLNVKARFLVDTGASGTVIPDEVAEKLQLAKVAAAKSKVAGGDVKIWPIYYVYLYVSGEGITVLAAGSPDKNEYLLGMDVMELLNFQLDLAGKKVLKPLKAFRFKTGEIVWMEGEPWKTLFGKPSSKRFNTAKQQ
ncbi:MAG: retropepsin-like aspartic protease [Candidatus Bathyarchaeia archaeon]